MPLIYSFKKVRGCLSVVMLRFFFSYMYFMEEYHLQRGTPPGKKWNYVIKNFHSDFRKNQVDLESWAKQLNNRYQKLLSLLSKADEYVSNGITKRWSVLWKLHLGPWYDKFTRYLIHNFALLYKFFIYFKQKYKNNRRIKYKPMNKYDVNKQE